MRRERQRARDSWRDRPTQRSADGGVCASCRRRPLAAWSRSDVTGAASTLSARRMASYTASQCRETSPSARAVVRLASSSRAFTRARLRPTAPRGHESLPERVQLLGDDLVVIHRRMIIARSKTVNSAKEHLLCDRLKSSRADVAQLVEHWLPKPGVVGSSPIVRSKGKPCKRGRGPPGILTRSRSPWPVLGPNAPRTRRAAASRRRRSTPGGVRKRARAW